ncbi:MAG: hypothetical protein ACKV2U_24015 [Bryobacteraceae bacterium]
MLRTSNQNYLCQPGETVQVDSQTDGGALAFFLDNLPSPGSSLQFNMPNAPGASRQLGAVLTGVTGNRSGIRIRVVSNRPNGQDVTILAIGSNANHAATVWDFLTASDSSVLSFAAAPAGPVPAKAAAKKASKKAAKKPKGK